MECCASYHEKQYRPGRILSLRMCLRARLAHSALCRRYLASPLPPYLLSSSPAVLPTRFPARCFFRNVPLYNFTVPNVRCFRLACALLCSVLQKVRVTFSAPPPITPPCPGFLGSPSSRTMEINPSSLLSTSLRISFFSKQLPCKSPPLLFMLPESTATVAFLPCTKNKSAHTGAFVSCETFTFQYGSQPPNSHPSAHSRGRCLHPARVSWRGSSSAC